MRNTFTLMNAARLTDPMVLVPTANGACSVVPLPPRLAHDLVQPLSVFEMLADLLEQSLLEGDVEECRDLVRDMRRAVTSELSLLDSLRLYLKINMQMLTPRLGPVSIVRVLEAAAERFNAAFQDVSLHVSMNLTREEYVESDTEFLPEILNRLLDNAGQHATSFVRVTLASDTNCPEAICLQIEDDGEVLSDTALRTLGVPFLRETERRRGRRAEPGLGLGLYVAAAFTAAAGHRLTIENLDGGVRLSLSLKNSSLSSSSAVEPAIEGNAQEGAGKSVVGIAISDPLVSEELATVLTVAGYKVLCRHSPPTRTLIENWTSENCEVILCLESLLMTPQDPEVAEAIANARNRGLGLLLLASPGPVSQGLSEGKTLFHGLVQVWRLQMPISPPRLIAGIESARRVAGAKG